MKSSTILAVPLLFAGLPAAAQAPQPQSLQMVPRPTPDADALAAAMRRLGANPRDLSSLIEAGELSLKLGDATAAASLFKRAELLDPMNGRVKAGMARILVQQERPGEALRFFDQAAGYGLDARSFAGDRGLAYDLIGEQTRAQRDYRLALAAGPQEDVQRRYALSLAISGKKDDALAQIDPLVRQSDRGAWRTRAFILAMGGDLSGATDIATRMMPPGMATGLQPFFKTLPSLGPVDRAFAVHFGEIRPTPARLADARLAPALPALPPEPAAAAPVTLAQAAAPVLRADVKKRAARERRQSARDRRREAQQRVQVASAARPAAVPLPDAPRYGSVNGVTFAAPRESGAVGACSADACADCVHRAGRCGDAETRAGCTGAGRECCDADPAACDIDHASADPNPNIACACACANTNTNTNTDCIGGGKCECRAAGCACRSHAEAGGGRCATCDWTEAGVRATFRGRAIGHQQPAAAHHNARPSARPSASTIIDDVGGNSRANAGLFRGGSGGQSARGWRADGDGRRQHADG